MTQESSTVVFVGPTIRIPVDERPHEIDPSYELTVVKLNPKNK